MKRKIREKGEGEFEITGPEFFWATLIIIALISIIKGYFVANDVDLIDIHPAIRGIIDLYLYLEPWIKLVALVASAILVYGIIYSVTERNRFYKIAHDRVNPPPPDPMDVYSNRKWERVMDHVNSPNESDWKLAILEADIMLDELLNKQGYQGSTMGEKLKQVDRSDFTTIDLAWEGHKVRNMVAHEGSEYLIPQREAERIIKLYESVFREFKYI
jgi:hypothetical protein